MSQIYKLNESLFNSIVTHEVKKLRDMFKRHGYEIRIVGGAVRDILMSKQPKDLDFATTASVLQMKAIFGEENITMVNPKGEKRGTVTACFACPQPFEISTINIRFPGQPAQDDWIRDAERRDLTINSMFLDFDGNVHDYCGGHDDLNNGNVRFIGNVEQAIEGRYYRILRYFRFLSQFAKDPAQHQDGLLQTFKMNAARLKRVHGERIWKDFKIIFQGKSRNVVIKTMMDIGIGPYIGIPRPNLAEFQKVSQKNKDNDIQPAGLLAALLHGQSDAQRLRDRFMYSWDESQLINYIIKNRTNTSDGSLLPYLQLIYTERNMSKHNVIKFVTELLKYNGAEELLNELQETPEFPIDEFMLKDNGVPLDKKHKQKTRFVVEKLIEYWYEHYDWTTEELLALIPNILQQYK